MEERLDLIRRLERKYGGTIESVTAFAVDSRKQLESISTAAERIGELETAETAALEKLSGQGLALSQKRKDSAGEMSKAIEVELDDLRMAAARFAVDFQTKPAADGVPLPDGTPRRF